MKKTTLTLTFQLSHQENLSEIDCIRKLISNLREYDDDGDVELLSHDEDDCDTYYTFTKHDGKYGRTFTFQTIDEFIRKYAKFGICGIATVVRDYGKFISCESKTEELEDT